MTAHKAASLPNRIEPKLATGTAEPFRNGAHRFMLSFNLHLPSGISSSWFCGIQPIVFPPSLKHMLSGGNTPRPAETCRKGCGESRSENKELLVECNPPRAR
jgi:hypothetical protein